MSRTLIASLSVAALIAAAAAAPAARAEDPPVFDPRQVTAIEKVLRDYLMQHPEIIADAIEALREKQLLELEAEAKKALETRKAEIFEDAATPVLGNPQGDVTIVEFFDYRCGYCKTVVDTLMDTVKADGKIRLIMKELPILGPESVVGARAALAARAQGKYAEMHRALMKVRGPFSPEAVLKAAAEAGLDIEKMKKDMEGADIAKQIERNVDLAQALNISGTPAFIIGDRMIPGAIDKGTMKTLIEQARKDKEKK